MIPVLSSTKKSVYHATCHQMLRFTQNSCLKVHSSIIHERKKEFHCKICGSNFSLNINLKRHSTSVHEGNKDHLNVMNCCIMCVQFVLMTKYRVTNVTFEFFPSFMDCCNMLIQMALMTKARVKSG